MTEASPDAFCSHTNAPFTPLSSGIIVKQTAEPVHNLTGLLTWHSGDGTQQRSEQRQRMT
jgi:hypothetical protein